MATATELRRIALSLPGTVEAPHFDRMGFKVQGEAHLRGARAR
jgi:hypothetical protein